MHLHLQPAALTSAEALAIFIVCLCIVAPLTAFGLWICETFMLLAELSHKPAEPQPSHMEEPEDDAVFARLSERDLVIIAGTMSTPECAQARQQFLDNAHRMMRRQFLDNAQRLSRPALIPLEEFNREPATCAAASLKCAPLIPFANPPQPSHPQSELKLTTTFSHA